MSLHSFTGVFLCNENSTFPMYGTVAFQPRFLNVYCVIFAALRIFQILPALVMPTGSAARRPDLFLRHRVVPSENLIYCPAVLPRISVNSSANITFIFESANGQHIYYIYYIPRISPERNSQRTGTILIDIKASPGSPFIRFPGRHLAL